MRELLETSPQGEQMAGQLYGPAIGIVHIFQHHEDGTKRFHHRLFAISESASD
jgi:hypothetical protein